MSQVVLIPYGAQYWSRPQVRSHLGPLTFLKIRNFVWNFRLKLELLPSRAFSPHISLKNQKVACGRFENFRLMNACLSCPKYSLLRGPETPLTMLSPPRPSLDQSLPCTQGDVRHWAARAADTSPETELGTALPAVPGQECCPQKLLSGLESATRAKCWSHKWISCICPRLKGQERQRNKRNSKHKTRLDKLSLGG